MYNINDKFGVKKDWENLKKFIYLIDRDIELFYSPKRNKKAGVRARNNINTVRKVLKEIKFKMLEQTRVYKNEKI